MEIPPNTGAEPHRLQALDLMRGMACLLVIIHHTSMLSPKPFLPWYANTLLRIPAFLWCGVDIFFVLSGFLITGLLLTAKKNSKRYFENFYARRALRLLPVYYVVLVIATLWDSIVPALSHTWWVQSLFWLDMPNFATSFQPKITGVFDQSWSLGVEEQFYLLWSVLVFRLTESRMKTVLIVIILGTPLLRIALLLMHAPHHFIHLSALTRSDGLAIGCLLALMWQNQQWQSTLKKYALLGLVITPLLILAYLALSNADSESAATLCVGIPLSNTFAAAMLIFLAGVKSIQVPLITPALSFVGKLSYSGYLLHGIVFQILLHYKLFPFQAFDGIPFYWVVVQPLLTGTVVVLTFFLSWLFWITFEHRFLLLKAKFEG